MKDRLKSGVASNAIIIPQGGYGSFLSSLSHHDLQRLRSIVKRIHMRYHPAELYTDREADKLIEALGPEILERQIKQIVDGKGLTVNGERV